MYGELIARLKYEAAAEDARLSDAAYYKQYQNILDVALYIAVGFLLGVVLSSTVISHH
jgi:hypothetical protein